MLDAFPGPLIVLTPPGAAPPLSPGYLALELPALSEHERADAWRDALAAHELPADPADRLAARFAIEPGTIARVLAGARLSGGADAATVETTLAASLRQHRAGRLGAIASQVARLASWDDVILSDDMRASLRELVGRVRCRSTVLERWGMERVAASARGVTALFQGGPGTGKTLAAGAIARELGFELWRVDLSRVLSKWLGETEKNLGAVFDAAEEGEIILLFSPGGDQLFAAGNDGVVWRWPVRDGRVDLAGRTVVARHTGAISALAVSFDGRWLASAARDDLVMRRALGDGHDDTLATGGAASAIAFDALGGIRAVTRTGAVVHAAIGSVATVIDHGAHAGVAVYPDRLAVALDDGAIAIETLGPHTFDQLAALLARATTYRLPAR